MKVLRRIPFLLIAVGLLVILGLPHVKAQGSAGFTKIASVTTGTAYTDSTCPDGATCLYEVTAANAVGESAPDGPVTAVIPATGTHTVALSWSAGTGGGTPTSYNVYQEQGTVPPVGFKAVVN
jgi:hypothetical protein